MKAFLIWSAAAVAYYAFAAWSWPKVRLWLLAFWDHPLTIIRADIAALEALKDKYKGVA